jgi:hypothetical protein
MIIDVLCHCPSCGVPIYTRSKDTRGLPIPEYICDCRFLAAVAGAPCWTVMPWYSAPPYPWSVPYPSWTPWPIITSGQTGDVIRLESNANYNFPSSDTHVRAGLA